jgi:hypothetical protein
MTLTYRIHSFDPTRNAARRIQRACNRITEENNQRSPVIASYSHRDQTMSLAFFTDDWFVRNPDPDEQRKACIREATRALEDIMSLSALTFTADLN